MMETGDRERFGLQMGSEKDSEPSRSSLSGAPDPKCRPAGKRRRRVSFRSLFHGKRGSRAAERPEGVAAAPPSRLPRTRQQPLPSTALSPAAPAPPAPEHPAPGAPSERLSRGRTSLGGEAPPRDRELLECPLCLVRLPAERLPELLGCGHRSCLCCLRQYLRIEITESRVQLSCPECAERLAPRQVADILDDAALLDKYEEFLLRRCLAADPDCRWCPAPDCGFAVIASGCASCPRLACRREGCGAEFCYHCKQAWHPNQTCDSARQQRAQSLHAHGTRSPSYAQEQGPESGADLRHLRCFRFAKHVRPQSRNVRSLTALVPPQPVRLHLLGQEAVEQEEEDSVAAGHAHRRPRGHHAHRRRGRARHAHRHPRLRRAQGIGVPIMLAYVYGVVPVSLCRGGGCGVSRGKGRGVRIDFDEDDGPITVADAWRALKSPSLGESGPDGGLSATSPGEGLSLAPGTVGDAPRFDTPEARAGKYGRPEVRAGEPAEETGGSGAGSDCAGGMAGTIVSSYTLPDRERTNLEVRVDIETEPSHLCLTSEEDLAPGAGEPLDRGAPGPPPGDVAPARPESIRGDPETSDTQSDDVGELTSDDCDSPRPEGPPPARAASCRAPSAPAEGLGARAADVAPYV
ncbi:E3 ubiquitin-protein ligase RNF19B isoform X3 [Phycodurus eques]|uniref:E3 ubiquitin-protein ligase RNF19B isoform X3 n=1 Tax=Phycodurus eques TaxID=693459 RepID=UPI002ACD3D03|nr:E3 ubiquitin-protein ligase RNF19B isoform X3 [Phycodurus eques]